MANAVLDGTDCVMLSGESAMGRYPVEAVEMLAKIAAAIEPQRPVITVSELFQGVDLKGKVLLAHLIPLGVEASFRYLTPAAVFVPTRSGATAMRIASFRLPVPVVAVSSRKATCQRLQFSSGVCPVLEIEHPENWSVYVKKWISDHGLAGNVAIVTEGPSTKQPETNHRMEVVDLRR